MAADRFPSFARRDQALYMSIRSCEAKIKAKKGCRTRFETALKGARELMCYLYWLGEDEIRRTDPDSLAYGQSLLAWLSPVEIAYVMQYELDERNLCLLQRWLSRSVQHLCSPETRAKVASRMAQFAEFGDMSVEEIRRQWPGGCTALGMAQGIRVNTHKFLSGKGWSAADTFHPWYGSYCDWYNRYERLYVCRNMIAEGTLVY